MDLHRIMNGPGEPAPKRRRMVEDDSGPRTLRTQQPSFYSGQYDARDAYPVKINSQPNLSCPKPSLYTAGQSHIYDNTAFLRHTEAGWPDRDSLLIRRQGQHGGIHEPTSELYGQQYSVPPGTGYQITGCSADILPKVLAGPMVEDVETGKPISSNSYLDTERVDQRFDDVVCFGRVN